MGEIVDLHKRSIPLEDDELIENLARYGDGTLSEAAVKKRHRLSAEEWAALGENDELVERMEARPLQRIRGGQTKRERAQIEIIDGPPLLGKIMRSPDSNARHVVDAIKTLDALATGGGEAAAGAGTIFEITINMGDESLHFSKPVAIDPNPLNNTDTSQEEWLPVIAASKKEDGGGQGHI